MRTVLVLANSGSGLYDFRAGLIERLIAEGDTVICAIPDEQCVRQLKALGASVVRTPINRRGMNPVQDMKLYRGYRALIRRVKPDVVLTYTIKPNIYGGYACRKEGVPYIATITGLGSVFQKHDKGTGAMSGFSSNTGDGSTVSGSIDTENRSSVLQRLVTSMYRTALSDCACLFFQNAHNRGVFDELKIPRGRTRLVAGSGVDLNRHTPEDYPGHTAEETCFLYVGRLMKEKGSVELLQAMRRLHENYPGRCILRTVGYVEEGDDATDTLSALIEEGLREDYLEQFPYDTDIHPYYTAADAVIMPSYHEGMSNVLMEASATARPVLASNIPGCQEIVQDTVTGFLFPSQDADALYHAMERFLQLPVAERRMMGRAARRKMEHDFDRTQIIDAYMEEINACT